MENASDMTEREEMGNRGYNDDFKSLEACEWLTRHGGPFSDSITALLQTLHSPGDSLYTPHCPPGIFLSRILDLLLAFVRNFFPQVSTGMTASSPYFGL